MTEGSQTKKQNLDLALIGNSCAAALVDQNARIVWWCFPHFDSDPVFSRLLAGDEEKGFCDVTLANLVETESHYVRNTAIVETILTDANGAKVRVADFAPNFERFERVYRPPQIIRRIEPIAGLPRIMIRVRPTHNYGCPTTNFVVGSNHIRYLDGAQVLRLTSDAPLSYIVNEISFPLNRPVNLIFGQDDPFLSAIETTSREFLDRTRDYWQAWVRYLALAYEWQVEVVRAAITLKLCSFAETGAIVAAHTTSIPEAPSSSRTWDYRYCWLRDAYFVVDALNRLGATQIMESYINYITTIASVDEEIRPLHGIVPFSPLEERIAPDLKGFLGMGPVRVGNQAASQRQNDVYGSVVLAATQMFVDERLPKMGDEALFRLLEGLGERAIVDAFKPDAGLWEYRTRAQPHTYSATLCWAACDRLAGIARRLKIADRAKYWATNARSLRTRILEEGWDEGRGALTGAFGSPDLDASVLLVAELELCPRTIPNSSRPATPSAASSHATAASCVIPRQMTSARRRPPFWHATSGISTLSIRSVALTKRGSCSNPFSRAATPTDFSPRISILTRESCGEICLRHIPWQASSIAPRGCRRVGRKHGRALDNRLQPRGGS